MNKDTMEAWISDAPLSDLLVANEELLKPYERHPKEGDDNADEASPPPIAFHPVDKKMSEISYDEPDCSEAIDLEALEKAGACFPLLLCPCP